MYRKVMWITGKGTAVYDKIIIAFDMKNWLYALRVWWSFRPGLDLAVEPVVHVKAITNESLSLIQHNSTNYNTTFRKERFII